MNSFDQIALLELIKDVIYVPCIVRIDKVEWVVSDKVALVKTLGFSESIEILIFEI